MRTVHKCKSHCVLHSTFSFFLLRRAFSFSILSGTKERIRARIFAFCLAETKSVRRGVHRRGARSSNRIIIIKTECGKRKEKKVQIQPSECCFFLIILITLPFAFSPTFLSLLLWPSRALRVVINENATESLHFLFVCPAAALLSPPLFAIVSLFILRFISFHLFCSSLTRPRWLSCTLSSDFARRQQITERFAIVTYLNLACELENKLNVRVRLSLKAVASFGAG